MTFNLTTTEGKTIKLNKVRIEVSANSKIDGGYFFDLRMHGVLPGCKKAQCISTSFFGGKDAISLATLFDNRKFHNVKYTEMAKMINQLEIVKPSYDHETVITPEVAQKAKDHILDFYGTERSV